jgi:hypothetical protein
MATKKRKAARKSTGKARKKTRKGAAKSRAGAKAAKSRKAVKSRTAAKSRARKAAHKRRPTSRQTSVYVARQPKTLRDRETPPPGAVEQMLDAAADTSRKAARKVKEILNL